MSTHALGLPRQPAVDRSSVEAVAQFQAYARFVSVDSTKNRFRFYSLIWQPCLWGGGALLRSWGRIGAKGRSLQTFYQDRESAQTMVDQLIRRRLQRGYQVADTR